MIKEKIQQIFSGYPSVIYGFTSVSYSSYASQYMSALVFAVPYGEQLTIKNYTEEKFEKGIQDAKKVLEEMLNQHKVKYYIPPVAQNNEEELVAPFSFKYAAVNAGLGWIGKNDVVITEKYGPRVRLSAVLIDNLFRYGQRIVKSNCPDSCRKCVEICPYNALHDVKWDIDTLRSDIIDYKLCNQKRSLYIEKHGRKNACGLCMAACPIGIQLECLNAKVKSSDKRNSRVPKKMWSSSHFFFGFFSMKLYDIYENSLFFCMENRQPETGLSN